MIKIVYEIGHFLYEHPLTKNVFPKLVNIFKPDSVVIDGDRFFIDKDDRVISAELLLSGKWEEYERELFSKTIQPGDTVIDIGAHIGTFTLVAAKKVGPTGQVFAFEPLLKNFLLLKKNVEANGYTNVTVVNKAISDENGSAKLFLSNEDNFGDQRIYDSVENRKFLKIKTVTLDSFLSKLKKVDVIKMDIQGSEIKALKGATKLLNKNNNIKLFTEVWPKALRQAGGSANQYLKLLKNNKFELYEIDSRNKKLKKVTAEKLLMNYPEDSPFNADLFCKKSGD